ncbi:MAG: MSHA biogenesis protein MshK [Flavobacteriales bacterium]|jgi:MSHA biogenesis protein MshK
MKKLLLVLCICLTNVQANTLQDPTRPSQNKPIFNTGQSSSVLAHSALKLTAIINSNEYKQAIINGRSVAEGQQVQGYRVILISQNHVILDGLEGKQTLFVNNNNNIKKDANNGF